MDGQVCLSAIVLHESEPISPRYEDITCIGPTTSSRIQYVQYVGNGAVSPQQPIIVTPLLNSVAQEADSYRDR